ncbi:MAG: methyltransferase domain-containing protein [Dokdonella sp.]
MKKTVADNSLRRIKEDIRADAEVARARASQSVLRGIAPGSIGQIAAPRDRFEIDELSNSHFVDFLERAYAALLRRTPDSSGFAEQVRLLESGRSKIEILGNLRFSGEGRAIGVRVPWLLPRYLLAKVTSVPVLGYAIEWLMCIGGLPRMLRHQRAADAYHAARTHELKGQLSGIVDQLEMLREDVARLERERAGVETQLQQFGDRFPLVHSEIGGAFNEIRDLRHLVLSMNHWLASLRQNLATLEAAEGEQLRKRDPLYAEIFAQTQLADQTRLPRFQQWASEFAAMLPAKAEVLDIGSGLDWLQCLSERGLNVTGVNTSNEVGERARAVGIAIAVAEPSVVLARLADQTMDAISILDFPALLRSLAAPTLLENLRRVLRPGGKLVLGVGPESATLIDSLEGRAAVPMSVELIERTLRVSGFVEIRRMAAQGDAQCIFASWPS